MHLIQTHVSFVLLAGEHVYKIKKPVDFGFLDYSTLGKRRYYCRQEVVLNSRLCADTYLGVIPLRECNGHITAGGAGGRTVEYAVHMRRLPEERMMDRLLEHGEVTPEMVEQLARRLAEFHASAETSARIAEYGDWAIRYNWDENVTQWTPHISRTISEEQDRILRAYGEAFFARRAETLQRRVRDLRIRRVHADLRSDAVCFVNGICIFDCVEFNRRINLLDVARDVGFLAMDLDYRGRSDLADAFVEEYLELSDDKDMREILDFYKSYSACVRAKVEGFRLSDPDIPALEKKEAQQAARRYFELACRYAATLPPAMLLITCGLPGTGKSWLARRLAEDTGFEVVSSDIVRKELAGISPSERRYEEFRSGIYGPEFTDRTYAALLDRARGLLSGGRSAILDASFVRRVHRQQARRLAKETGAQFACIQIETPRELVRKRLERRKGDEWDPSDARWQVYVALKRRLQRPSEIPAERRIVVNGGSALQAQTRGVLAGLRKISPLSVARTPDVRGPAFLSTSSARRGGLKLR